MFEDLPDERTQFRRARQIGAVACEIDAGEDDFGVAVGNRTAQIAARAPDRHRTQMAATEWNDAESTGVIAAILPLHESAGSAGKRLDKMRRGAPHRHDVVDDRSSRAA